MEMNKNKKYLVNKIDLTISKNLEKTRDYFPFSYILINLFF